MADCPISCVKEVGKYIATDCLWPPVKRHIYYWWCFDDNIQGLGQEIRYLERERLDIDKKIEEARLRAESPTTEIQNWSKDSTQKLEEATRISQGCDDLKAWNIFSRYAVGKNAKQMAEDLEKLREDVNLIRIADPAPPPSTVSISHEPTMEFESRKRIEEDIMECLNDNQVSMIAICGPGGVGKTTMVQRIVNSVRKDKLFDEVMMVVIGQQIEMLKIQNEVAELLGLSFSESTLAARASKLCTRLLDSKRKLIIFDDVWEKFNLSEIGFPFGNCSPRCKIILTSRVKDACVKMNAHKIISLEVLTKEEAWSLFKEKAGSDMEEGSDLQPIAEAVAAECEGLPVALVTVGEALKNQSIHVWRDSLSQLRKSIPIDFPEVIKDVYKPLKLSYDSLKSRSLESIFLLCCLFPEDYDIPIELLTLYGTGLDIFEEVRDIEEGRDRAYSIVERLKSRFLLMTGSHMSISSRVHKSYLMEKHCVKMHDVVRDVAIFIGSEEKHGFLKSLLVSSMDSSTRNCNWMSIDISIENIKFPVGSEFPNLRLLMILDSTSGLLPEAFDANIICFKKMEELNVLSFSNIKLRSLPPTLVEDISVVGKLETLEILCIHDCRNIEELPANVGRLNCLRYLELDYKCRYLKPIVAGVISSLIRLEELKIPRFDKWEAKENQSGEKNARLLELESLPSLTSLEIHISDSNLAAQQICLSQKLVRYWICFGTFWHSYDDMEHERNIALDLRRVTRVGNWIHQLAKSTQSLELKGDGSNNFNLAETKSLRRIKISDCSTMKKLVNAKDCKVFTMLQHLELSSLDELESIINGTILEGYNSFRNLKSLIVEYMPKLWYLWKGLNQNISLGNLISVSIICCHNLHYIFSLATVRSIVQLQRLNIGGCYKIEQVFWNERESDIDVSIIEFPMLQEMRLHNLPKLESFSQGFEIMELPQLTKLQITDCPKLRTKIGKCLNLRTIDFRAFNGLHHLLSSCCTRKWNTQPQKLAINNNETIEEILWDEMGYEGERYIIFPALTELELSDLPRLTTFYKGVESIKFPKLEKMSIGGLARMNSLLPLDSEATHDQHCLHFFCNQKVEIPCLRRLQINNLQDTISKIWCRHVPINFFRNLYSLFVSDVVGIRNLMSSLIAKNLVKLRHLYIRGCQEMVAVIEDEKKVFDKLLFPNLKRVEIDKCPLMETFSLGYVRAPVLSEFLINTQKVERKGLNKGIRDHFMKKRKDLSGDLNLWEAFTRGHQQEDNIFADARSREIDIKDEEDEEQATFSQPEKDSLSYDFLETAECLAEQRNDGNSMRIADPDPQPSEISLSHHESTLEFESRRCIEEDISEFELRRRINEEDIMESLNDDHVHAIAVCGAGDAERTTMLRRIEDKARNTLFDEVVMVVVGQQNDLLKIQKEIAELLGLEFSHEDTPARRAYKLFIRLLDSKRKLIIFDDLWKSFKLEHIGVPFGNGFKDCKIILTSRIKEVCEEMGAYKVVQIEDVQNVPEEMNTECLPFFKCSDICNIYKRMRMRTSEEEDEE